MKLCADELQPGDIVNDEDGYVTVDVVSHDDNGVWIEWSDGDCGYTHGLFEMVD